MTSVMRSSAHSPRDSTVRSAALLFRERGVAGTGLRDVVEHAGAPRGSLQHYFPGGKRELLAEAMAWTAERAARPLRAAVAADTPPPPWEVVRGLLDRFRELLSLTDFRGGCPIVAAVTDASWDSPAVADAARKAFATWLAPLQEALVRGGLAEERAARVALLVISAAEGALVISRARRDVTALDAVQEELELLLRSDGQAGEAARSAHG
jgi:AcrR family transcriptional regulator